MIEIDLARPADDRAIVSALRSRGVEATPDARPARSEVEDPIPWEGDDRTRRRLLCRCRRRTKLVSSETVRWPAALPLAVDPTQRPRDLFEPWFLRRGGEYDILARARMRTAPRRSTIAALSSMGFDVAMMLAVRRERNTEGASSTVWYARARWTGPSSIVSPDDPLFFDTIQEIHHP